MQYTFTPMVDGPDTVDGTQGLVQEFPDTVCLSGQKVYAKNPREYTVSKFIVIERIIARGLFDSFYAILNQPEMRQMLFRWNATIDLVSTSPLLIGARDQLLPLIGCTAETAEEILREGRDIP